MGDILRGEGGSSLGQDGSIKYYKNSRLDQVSQDDLVSVSIRELSADLQAERSDPIYFKGGEKKAVRKLLAEVIGKMEEESGYFDMQNRGNSIVFSVYGKYLGSVYQKLKDAGFPEFQHLV